MLVSETPLGLDGTRHGLMTLPIPQPRNDATAVATVSPPTSLIISSLVSPHGHMYVEVYQHGALEANPSFALRADRDGRWYRLFADQFETLWESGRPVSLRG